MATLNIGQSIIPGVNNVYSTTTCFLANSVVVEVQIGKVNLSDSTTLAAVGVQRNPDIPFLREGVYGTLDSKGKFEPTSYTIYGRPTDKANGKTILMTSEGLKTFQSYIKGFGVHTNLDGLLTCKGTLEREGKSFTSYHLLLEDVPTLGKHHFRCTSDGFKLNLVVVEHATELMKEKFICS